MKTKDKNDGIKVTKDYGLFELHEHNRDIRKGNVKEIKKSMRIHGFRKSDAIHVQRTPSGKYKIMRGHHRFVAAKELGMPIFYIVDNIEFDITKEEGKYNTKWTGLEHVKAYAKQGNKEYMFLIDFAEANKIPVSVAAFLLMGLGAYCGTVMRTLKDGTFKVKKSTFDHAQLVVETANACEERGLSFTRARPFITALAAALLVEDFNVQWFLQRVKVDGGKMLTRSTRDDYLQEIEDLYNFRNKGAYVPIRGYAIAKAGKIES